MRSRQSYPFFLAAAIGGAALHVTRDKALSAAKHASRRSRKLVHHVSSDARGVVERATHARGRAEELDDSTLVNKVESIVFRHRDVPKGQININAENGVVFLRGEVERPELVDALEARVLKVRGVRGVENLLHTPGNAPPNSER